MTKALATMSAQEHAVFRKLKLDEMPTAAHRELLLARRRRTRREARVLAAVAWMIPLTLVVAIKRAGVGEAWYDAPPAEIAAAFGELAAPKRPT
jgi:hypothetical protein